MRPLTRQGQVFLLALYVAGLLGCLALFWVGSAPLPQATATPTTDSRPPTATVDHRQPTATVIATATAEPVTAEPVTHVPGTATSTAPASTPMATATPPMICRAGVITAHAAMEAVLANRPERRCQDCVYFASVLCQDIGQRLTLRAAGVTLPVVVVDCATWSVGRWPQKEGEDWLGELDIRSWPKAPLAPLKAELCVTTAAPSTVVEPDYPMLVEIPHVER